MDLSSSVFGVILKSLPYIKKYLFANPFDFRSQKVTAHIRKAICDFQLLTTDYQFKLSQTHKKFKETTNKSEKAIYYTQLKSYSESGFKIHTDKLKTILIEYLVSTRFLDQKPRVGIYLFEKDNIVTNIFTKSTKSIEEYTIFKTLIKGEPYVDNCIPKSAKKTDYLHAGMNQRRRALYKYKRIIDSEFISRKINSWIKRPSQDNNWIRVSEDNDAETFYKSHLAVPITFLNHGNVIDESFSKLINLHENGRSILGFILVDHERPYYFDNNNVDGLENIDINVLYVLADILSFSFVTKLTYFDKSTTVLSYTSQN